MKKEYYTMKTKINIEISVKEVLKLLKGLNADDVITLHNLYCDLHRLSSSYIYYNTEEVILKAFDHNPKEIVWGMKSTLYNPKDKYFYILDNGKMVSYKTITQFICEYLAKSIVENFDHYKEYIRFDIRMM